MDASSASFSPSAILFLLGGVLGSAAGFVGIRWVLSLGEFGLPFAREGSWSITMDWRVMTFVLVVSLTTGVLFGLFPHFSTRGSARA